MDDSIYKLINFKDFICNLFFENNMSYEDFYDGKNLKANKNIHAQILEYIKDNFTEKEIKYINSNFSALTENDYFEYGKKEEKDLAKKVISKYLKVSDFFMKYYTIKNGDIVLRELGISYINGNSQSELIKQMLTTKDMVYQNKRTKDIPIIITENGNVYFAFTFHNDLIPWLTFMGEDLSNAVNLRVSYSNNGYISIESTDIAKNMVKYKGRKLYYSILSEQQVAQIINIYMVCINNNRNFDSLEYTFAGPLTFGLGFDFFTYGGHKIKNGQLLNVTEQNIRTLGLFRRYISIDELAIKIKNNKQTNQWI